MDTLSIALVSKALDGLSLRAAATAQNIANVNSEGYSPVGVSFEESLREASRMGIDAIGKVRPEMARTPQGDIGGSIRLDLEMAEASRTSLRYSALVEVLNRQLQIGHAIVRGGRQ
ncbi:flagellar basal body rod protein FlgB [Pelagerythrobacter marensis]|uniref:Flagellar basal body rod protein FlgB n=1 Tax=Pelagerythrobacter marensis TaxID=543877 RepID=A0A0G3XC27_9SPHN|nr:hypothetical protein [Pelagerythrobacter marensis]AKM07963.1 Putative flagellar basal-body rod protein FlgB [Pelagerythrobacter marensis]